TPHPNFSQHRSDLTGPSYQDPDASEQGVLGATDALLAWERDQRGNHSNPARYYPSSHTDYSLHRQHLSSDSHYTGSPFYGSRPPTPHPHFNQHHSDLTGPSYQGHRQNDASRANYIYRQNGQEGSETGIQYDRDESFNAMMNQITNMSDQ